MADPKRHTERDLVRLKQRYDAKMLVDLVAFAGIMIATAVFNNVAEVDFPDPELEAFAEGAAQ